MRRLLFFIAFIYIHAGAFGNDYTKVDMQSGGVPNTLNTASQISYYLTKNVCSPQEKVRAIFYWISHTITYDVSQLNAGTNFYVGGERNLLNEVLQTRTGVCQHYVELFHACCQAAGIESYIISGYTKTHGVISTLSHAWNAVCIEGKYYNIDVTWASGYVDNNHFTAFFDNKYFMVVPSDFIKTHVPFDPIWQFLNNPISNQEFLDNDFIKLNIPANFNFTDSITSFACADTLNRLIFQNKRIINQGLTNDLLRRKVFENEQNISHLKYNNAIKEFNQGIEAYNAYVQKKNEQFDAATLSGDKILELLDAAQKHTINAERGICLLKAVNFNTSTSIIKIQKSIEIIKQNISTEMDFAQKYIKTLQPLRLMLFYK